MRPYHRRSSPVAQRSQQPQVLAVLGCFPRRLEHERDAASRRMPKQFGERLDAYAALPDAFVVVPVRSAGILGVVGVDPLEAGRAGRRDQRVQRRRHPARGGQVVAGRPELFEAGEEIVAGHMGDARGEPELGGELLDRPGAAGRIEPSGVGHHPDPPVLAEAHDLFELRREGTGVAAFGVAGVVLGWWGTRTLAALQPTGMLPVPNVHMDVRVLLGAVERRLRAWIGRLPGAG